ncbi:hypothetical protein GIB67_009628 [Kingdonia uniflora]|uniref:Uncharacterized protein n=1 Tax=Kingdonia uniflora TaxID=39325 RepID=A0A7J7M2B2_9MAGN|nr:hypothetical protein GIB67_009628 [Kingdonia uniflora]
MEVSLDGSNSLPDGANDYIYENEYSGDFGPIGPSKSLVLSGVEYEQARKWSRHNDFLKRRKTAGKRKSGSIHLITGGRSTGEGDGGDDTGTGADGGDAATIPKPEPICLSSIITELCAKKKRGPSRGPASLPDRRKRNVSVNHLGRFYRLGVAHHQKHLWGHVNIHHQCFIVISIKKCTPDSQKDRGVARGEVVAIDLDTLIHNVILGDGFYKIFLSKVMKPRTPLSKDDGYSEDLGDFGEGAYIAWAIWCLEFDK